METHSTGSESEKALSSAPPEIDAAVEDNPEFSPHSRESGGAISAQTERTNWSAQAHKANLPDPPNEAVYYGLAGEFVSAVEPYTEADPVALLAGSREGVAARSRRHHGGHPPPRRGVVSSRNQQP